MPSHIEYSDTVRQLAAQAHAITKVRDVLYHGTRYTRSILDSDVLFRALIGEQKVCLTRSAETAAYWAMIRRDDDEGRGAILISTGGLWNGDITLMLFPDLIGIRVASDKR